MKSNIIALKTQETEQDFSVLIEPRIIQKFAQVGVEITKTITFNSINEMEKSMFYLLEPCSIVFVDFSCAGFELIIKEINKFYAVKQNDFNGGKYWHDEVNKRFCILFNIENVGFINHIDDKFLKTLLAPTKYLSVIKTYGISDSEIKKALQVINNPHNFEYYVTSNFLDCEIDVLVDADFYKSQALDSYLRQIYQILEKYIYSDEPETLYEKLEEILDLRNIKLCFCDFFTAGQFQYLLKNNLKSYGKNVKEFVEIYNHEELVKKVGFPQNILEKMGYSCEELIYETAFYMLNKKSGDIAVVLYKDGDKYYIAIGDEEAIHLYKFTFSQSKSFITNIIIQTAIFKILKKLKKNSGLF